MKVTNSVVFKNFLFNMRREQGIMEELRVMAASGKKVNRPSDNPADMQRILRLRQSLTQLDQYDRNIGRGLGLLSMAETGLADSNGILQRLKEIAVDGADGATPSSARVALAEEVVGLRNQLMQVANVRFDGQRAKQHIREWAPTAATPGKSRSRPLRTAGLVSPSREARSSERPQAELMCLRPSTAWRPLCDQKI
jgi:hypothetical protein